MHPLVKWFSVLLAGQSFLFSLLALALPYWTVYCEVEPLSGQQACTNVCIVSTAATTTQYHHASKTVALDTNTCCCVHIHNVYSQIGLWKSCSDKFLGGNECFGSTFVFPPLDLKINFIITCRAAVHCPPSLSPRPSNPSPSQPSAPANFAGHFRATRAFVIIAMIISLVSTFFAVQVAMGRVEFAAVRAKWHITAGVQGIT